MRTVCAAPSAASLIQSMRDLGYSLETALADVVDNSVTAHASRIEILAETTTPAVKIGVLDNGDGMSEKQLLAAMRLGSQNPLEERESSDLGRFGLGLKTASLSQCRVLTVISRRDGVTSAAVWNLEHVEEADDWLLEIPEDLTSVPWVDQLGEHGTLVVWQELDRLMEQHSSRNEPMDHAHVVRRIDNAREHLELVFHRFLSGERGLTKVQILLNGRPLEPFDPFHSSHRATIVGPVEKIRVGGQVVTVQAYTLPHHTKVTPSDWDRYAGPAGYLKNQGFYVYRVKDKGEIRYEVNPDHPVLADFNAALPEDLRASFLRVLELTSAALPFDALLADFSGEPEKVGGSSLSDEALQYAVATTVPRLRDDCVSDDRIVEMLRFAEPFRSNWSRTESLLDLMFAKEVTDV